MLADATDPWIRWDWVGRHIPVIAAALVQHVELTAIAVLGGLAISVPFALWAWRIPLVRDPVFAVSGILYTILMRFYHVEEKLAGAENTIPS